MWWANIKVAFRVRGSKIVAILTLVEIRIDRLHQKPNHNDLNGTQVMNTQKNVIWKIFPIVAAVFKCIFAYHLRIFIILCFSFVSLKQLLMG
jgi:hypothetical protein